MKTPLVSISCATYNQEDFIRPCFDGFLMQETSFPFEVLVHDDASTDQTAAIIREYEALHPGLFRVIYQTENQYKKGNKRITATFNLPRARGKYIALCEGDDYWTDPLKLQKQVDFLEMHPDFNLCCHDWEVDTNGTISRSPVHALYKEPLTFEFATLPWVWITKTMTLLFRNHAFDYNLLQRYQYGRDVHLVYHLLTGGRGYFIPEVMSRYRVHGGGIWGGRGALEKNRTTYELYKELFNYESNNAVRKRYLNAGLAYFNGRLYNPQGFRAFWSNWRIYGECLLSLRDMKDVFFAVGALFPPRWVSLVMRHFRI